jgi:hypothetical protein
LELLMYVVTGLSAGAVGGGTITPPFELCNTVESEPVAVVAGVMITRSDFEPLMTVVPEALDDCDFVTTTGPGSGREGVIGSESAPESGVSINRAADLVPLMNVSSDTDGDRQLNAFAR